MFVVSGLHKNGKLNDFKVAGNKNVSVPAVFFKKRHPLLPAGVFWTFGGRTPTEMALLEPRQSLVANDPVEGQAVVENVSAFGDGELEGQTNLLVPAGLELHTDGGGDNVIAGHVG